MGKTFCKIEKKWCKYLKHDICHYSDENIDLISRCKRLKDIETRRLSDILKEVEFEDVFTALCHWYSDQEGSKEGYRKVFNTISSMRPKKHNLNDLFIDITKAIDEYDNSEYIDVSGTYVIGHDNKSYGIEFCNWNDWISMFITQESIDTFTNEEIVAGCLYEMTFFGFEEEKVKEEEKKLISSIEEAKEQYGKEKEKK